MIASNFHVSCHVEYARSYTHKYTHTHKHTHKHKHTHTHTHKRKNTHTHTQSYHHEITHTHTHTHKNTHTHTLALPLSFCRSFLLAHARSLSRSFMLGSSLASPHTRTRTYRQALNHRPLSAKPDHKRISSSSSSISSCTSFGNLLRSRTNTPHATHASVEAQLPTNSMYHGTAHRLANLSWNKHTPVKDTFKFMSQGVELRV